MVRITGLYLVVAPNTDASSTAEAKRQSEIAAKRATIADLNTVDPESPAPDEDSGSFTSRLINKIVNNIQLKVSNVHVRYEDNYTDS